MTIDSASGVNSVLLLVGRAHSEEEKLDYKVEHSRLKCADKAKSVKPLECVCLSKLLTRIILVTYR